MKKLTEKEYQDLMQRFADAWGVKSQQVMAIEEMSELQKELCKYLRRTENSGEYTKEEIEETISNIQEEIADVLIIVTQMRSIFGADEVDKMIDRKLQRGAERLEKWMKEQK
ncbi:hypothetical protein FWC31_02455 [Candidatus Saccharibacteria bacterium]|nr:hypothetical protein [Candidatus Saccharibacteria bacterium]